MHPKIQQLVSLLSSESNHVFHLEHVSISELLQRMPTPFFAYSGQAILKTVEAIRQATQHQFELFFSIKANPSLGICQLLQQAGVGAELASIGELHVAKKANFEIDKIVFAGPGKTNEELEAVFGLGVGFVHVESLGELQRLANLATRYQKQVRVGLRINPKEPLQGAQMRMGGGPSQFGIDEEQVPHVIQTFLHHAYVRIVGIHCYVGTQIFDARVFAAHAHRVLDLAQQVALCLHQPLELIDFGGGWGVPYFENLEPLDLNAMGHALMGVYDRMQSMPLLQQARPVIELGRYLVASSGVYVTRVVDVKTSHGQTYVVTDGGMNHHITATGNFGQLFRKPYPMAHLTRMHEPHEMPVHVVGPCCTPLDTLGTHVMMPPLQPQDVIGVFYSGAYGLSASSLMFLSHPWPGEMLVHDHHVHVLRQAGASDAVLNGQIPLEHLLS